jgi:4-diphosphocytidyl-2-C-methyl-D-erythritol kinase
VAEAVARSAPAKINVFLRVLGAREDGYHAIESLLLPLSLADTVTARAGDALRVEVAGSPELAEAVGTGGMNLALVAALALGDACETGGALVQVDKRVPVAAGLGGGSADAAATLLVLNELWGCGLDTETLLGVGGRVGSDVPALLVGGPVLVGGRGERLEPVKIPETFWVLVPFGFPTRSPDAYRWWDEDGAATGPDPSAVVEAATGGDIGALGRLLFNDLEGPVASRHAQVARTKQALIEAGALGAVMSGSGPTIAALARSELHAAELAAGFGSAIVARAPGSA